MFLLPGKIRASFSIVNWLRDKMGRVAVTIMDSAEVVGTDGYAPLGYVERARFGDFRVIEHVPSALK